MTGRVALLLVLAACSPAAIVPVKIDTNADTCHSCRMTISNPRLAVQVIDPGEEPRLFDDIGCAANALRQERGTPRGRHIFVADLKTGSWLPADSATFERCANIDTPMGSHLVARTTSSGDAQCTSVSWKEILR